MKVQKQIHILPNHGLYAPVSKYMLQEFHPVDMDKHGKFNIYRDYLSKAYTIPTNADMASVHKTSLEPLPECGLKIASYPFCVDKGFVENPGDKDSLKEKGRKSIERQIDREVFSIINASTPADHIISVRGFAAPETIGFAISMLDNHEVPIGCIVCNPKVYRQMETSFDNFVPLNWNQTKPIRGHHRDIPVITSSVCFPEMVFVVAEPQYVGALMYFDNYEEKYITNSEGHGWSITRECGFIVANKYALAKIQIS